NQSRSCNRENAPQQNNFADALDFESCTSPINAAIRGLDTGEYVPARRYPKTRFASAKLDLLTRCRKLSRPLDGCTYHGSGSGFFGSSCIPWASCNRPRVCRRDGTFAHSRFGELGVDAGEVCGRE